jgi:uncharacterized protein (TIGR03643 family)
VKVKRQELSQEQTDQIIRMAWEDRSSFEKIKKRAGLTETQVIEVMRRELKPRSFRLWRERVSGRVTKHRKRFKRAAFKGSFE